MQKDVEEIRSQIRSVLREVNDLITDIERNSLPEGTHALASALRSRIDDLGGAIDGVLDPGQVIGRSVRAPQPAAAAAVDESALTNLLEDLGDASRVSYLVQLFLSELHARRQALAAAVESSDLAAAKGVAHTLKSSALLLGAAPLGQACDRLSANEDPARLRALADDVTTHATAAARWFQIWLSNQPVNP
ncbi:MAG: Hpt domain [Actinomycetota bacterium]